MVGVPSFTVGKIGEPFKVLDLFTQFKVACRGDLSDLLSLVGSALAVGIVETVSATVTMPTRRDRPLIISVDQPDGCPRPINRVNKQALASM
jgi:hypothetical protein